jgi:hypothetical protein
MIDALSRDHLVRFLSIQFRYFYNFGLRQFSDQTVHGRLINRSQVAEQLVMRFYAVGRFPEIGDKIQDVNFFHGLKILVLVLNGIHFPWVTGVVIPWAQKSERQSVVPWSHKTSW